MAFHLLDLFTCNQYTYIQTCDVLSCNARTLNTNEYTIKNTFKFAEELQSFDSKLAMASCDIESLFTNIPLEETIGLGVENLFKDRTHVDNLSKTLSVSCLLGPCMNH